MKRSQELPAGGGSSLQASAASRTRAAAAPAYRVTSAASLSSTDSAITSTASSSLPLSGGGRAAAVARHCPRRKDRSPPLVTRSATAQIPPGVIMTKQVLVRVKPCPANRSGADSASTGGRATSRSRSGLITSTGKGSSDSRHSSSSSCEGRLNILRETTSHTRQANTQHEGSAPGGSLGTSRDMNCVSEAASAHETSPAASGAPVASIALHLSKGTGVGSVHDAVKASGSARENAVRKGKRFQASSARTDSSTGGKKAQETEIAGNTTAASGAVNASSTPVKDMYRKEAATAQQQFQQQQDSTQKPPQSQQQHMQQQQRPNRFVQEQLLSEETLSTKKEESQGIKAEGARAGTTKAKPKTKVVVRLLPPSVTEEELWALVPEEMKDHIAWRKFYPGSHVNFDTTVVTPKDSIVHYTGDKRGRTSFFQNAASAGDGGSYVKTSVWFLNCISPTAAEELIRIFHGKCFVDERHTTFKAIAALAPYQKTPRKKATENKLEGQIEEEPLYASFLETLNNGVSVDAQGPPNNGMEQLAIMRDDDGALITAMLLETRERYNVKTTVNGHLYTLAMWRQNISLLNGGAVNG